MARFRKTAAIGIAIVAAMAGGGTVHAGSGAAEDGADTFNVPAGTTVTAAGSASLFLLTSGVTIDCATSSLAGRIPTRATLKFNVAPPAFTDAAGTPCTDSSGNTYTFAANATNGRWTLAELDYKNHGGGDEGGEPNFHDHMQVGMPASGLVITSSLGCTITVAPSAAWGVNGKYDDYGSFTLSGARVPVAVTGGPQCTADTGAELSANYSLSPAIFDLG